MISGNETLELALADFKTNSDYTSDDQVMLVWYFFNENINAIAYNICFLSFLFWGTFAFIE